MLFKIEKTESVSAPTYDTKVVYTLIVGEAEVYLTEQNLLYLHGFLGQYIDMNRHELGVDEED